MEEIENTILLYSHITTQQSGGHVAVLAILPDRKNPKSKDSANFPASPPPNLKTHLSTAMGGVRRYKGSNSRFGFGLDNCHI
jgi:hypothetical protein